MCTTHFINLKSFAAIPFSPIFSESGEFGARPGTPVLLQKKREKTKELFVHERFAVARKDVPLAVDRNRLKRLMREAFRVNKAGIVIAAKDKNLQIDLVLIFKILRGSEIGKIRYSAVESALTEVLAKIISLV